MTELYAPAVIEDFTAGDRFFFQSDSRIKLGTVSNAANGVLIAMMDDNTCVTFPARYILDFQRQDKAIGKPLNLYELKEGMIISRFEVNRRIYASVCSYVPGVELSYHIRNQRVIMEAREKSFGQTIEEQMAHWEIEG